MEQARCPRCGRVFVPGADRFTFPTPFPGCRPGRQWLHDDARSARKRPCLYGDGEVGTCPPTGVVALPAGERRAA